MVKNIGGMKSRKFEKPIIARERRLTFFLDEKVRDPHKINTSYRGKWIHDNGLESTCEVTQGRLDKMEIIDDGQR